MPSNHPAINKAAGDFLSKLPGTDLKKDLTLAAEMAGLMLYRASPANQMKIPPGTPVLGAIPDDAGAALVSFVLAIAPANGLTRKDIDMAVLPAGNKEYLPELTQFEQPFYDACHANKIDRELFPFVAAAAAVKLILAGIQLKLLDPKLALATALFHIVAGSKTAPFPANSIPSQASR
jgi:hypothetical protein